MGVFSSGIGIVEGWCGIIVYCVEIDVDGCIIWVKVVDLFWFNWFVLLVVMVDIIVFDFLLVNKSFN